MLEQPLITANEKLATIFNNFKIILNYILYVNSLCPFVRLTWQFCILIHRQNRPLPAFACSDPVSCEADSATLLCVRSSVHLSGCICFFFYLFFLGFFSWSFKLINMKKQKEMGFAFLRKKKDLDLCFTCSKKSGLGKSDRKMG
jgi:hypothetical protein